ncbi:degenerin deg-1-like [Stylophora pistillata]|nr:degenerin deg-1-like [Stylophora pistillata]
MAAATEYNVKKVGEDNQSPKELVKNFCGYTTTHGVGRLAEAKTLFSRFIWTVFILGAFAMFIFQTHGLFTLWLSRPVATVVKVKHTAHSIFPAVTICNQNPIKESEISKRYFDEIYQEIDERMEEQKNVASKDSDSTVRPTSETTVLPTTDDGLDPPVSASGSGDGDPSPTNNDTTEHYTPEEQFIVDYLFEDLLLSFLALENQTTLHKMGHKYEDFVYDCNFRGIDCRENYSKYWNRFWDYRYGNCYTFNGGVDDDHNNQTILETHNTGPYGGLKLNLNIESNEYVPEISQAAGARIVIHPQGEMPFPDEEGVDLVPGFSTTIGVRREVVIRVDPFNNGSCKHSNSEQKNDLYKVKYGSFYSRESCMRSCLAIAQIKKCGCADARFPVEDRHICNTVKKPDTATCYEELTSQFNEEGLHCDKDCPVPCSELIYKTSMSMAEWPSEGFQEVLYNRVIKRKNAAAKNQEKEGPEFLNRNFLQVKVFYERLNFQEVQEHLSYKGINLIADIGGQLGLWIGISVLTCCEVLELVLLLGQTVFKRVTAKGSRVEIRQ